MFRHDPPLEFLRSIRFLNGFDTLARVYRNTMNSKVFREIPRLSWHLLDHFNVQGVISRCMSQQKVGKRSAKSRQKVGKMICRDLAESCCTWNLFQWFSLVFDSLHSMLYGFVGQCVADRLESSPCNLPHLHLVSFPLYL